MGLFDSLGAAVATPLANATKTVIGQGTAAVTGYITQNFNLPSATQKVAELGSKLVKTGQVGSFPVPFVNKTPIGSNVVTAMNQMQAKEALRQSEKKGTPTNLLPGKSGNTLELKVKITQMPSVSDTPNEIIFTVMPRIEESGSVEYEQIVPIHHPGVIQKYRNTSARSWQISGRLISRTVEEATQNLKLINMIRAWRMPFYGEGTGTTGNTAAKLGAPPPILKLQAYGKHMIGPVMCVMKSYNTTWDNTVDYIPTSDGNPFPVILDVTISLEESWSPSEFSKFNLAKYKLGDLPAAFGG